MSVDERRQAESAFSADRDCVIVATSTLELGIDVGDLDRVIQIDSPATVASFLQRIGRTGPRPGSNRNCLFLCLEEGALLQAAGLLSLWQDGWVEPVTPPPQPVHLLAQQLMALTLQQGQVGRQLWREWIGDLPTFAAMNPDPAEEILAWMIDEAMLTDEQGMLSFGIGGEHTYGRRNFLDLIAVFTSAPLFTVWHGRRELGTIDPTSLQRRQDGPAVILLGGRSWQVTHVDWGRRQAFVEPSADRGRSRWGSAAVPLSVELCQAIARVLHGHTPAVEWSQRARTVLTGARAEMPWARPNANAIVTGTEDRLQWWTFGGLHANLALAEHLPVAGSVNAVTNLTVPIASGVTTAGATAAMAELRRRPSDQLVPSVSPAAVAGLKFNECLPVHLAMRTLAGRLADPAGIEQVLGGPVIQVRGPDVS